MTDTTKKRKSESTNPKKDTLEVISYRIDKQTFAQLSEMAKLERDEAGAPLNPSTFARRLMREALAARRKKSKS